jgi:hypothetical protein
MARRYSIEGPDKFLYEFDGPENASQEQIMSYAKSLHERRQESLQTAGVGEALKGGAKRMFGSLGTGVSSIFGAEEAAKEGLARQEAITEKPGASLEKVKSVLGEKGYLAAAGEAVSQIPTAIAEQFPNLAATIGSARLGAMAGSPFGPYGALIGGIGGAFVPSLVQQTGSNLERQAQEGAPISGSGALTAAAPQAALDVFTDKLLFGRLMGIPAKALGRADADAVVAKSLKRTLAEGTATGVVAEVPTEVAQQMLERYQAGLSLTDEEARKEYADTAYQVALLGPLGAVGKLQERGEARGVIAQDVAAQQAAAQQAQRQATGVMEQQPLFAPQEMPIPEPTLTPQETPEAAVAEEPVPEGQGDLFTARGAPSPAAKASVEAARLQGLPTQIEALNQTPEGRAELAGNMKLYFPELKGAERNKTRQAIQQGVYGVEPVAPVEGELTPEILKSFGIKSGPKYKALAGANLADPTTYNLLTTAAATNTDFGVKANRILDAFGHLIPSSEEADVSTQPKATEVLNEPEAQAEPVQPDFFGVPAVGATPIESGTEQGMGQPVQQQGAAPTQVEEPVGGGVAVPSGAPDGNLGQPAASADVQPSALAPIPKGEARKAAAALKKEPVAVTWGYLSDTPFAKLSKSAKDRVKDAHAQGYLTQDLADNIDLIEQGNITKAAVANKIATGSPEMAAQVLSNNIEEAIATQQDLEADPTATQAKKDAAVKKVAKLQKQLAKLTAEETQPETKKSMAIGAGKSENTAKSVRDVISKLFASTPLFDNKVHVFNTEAEAIDAEIMTELNESGAQGVYKSSTGKIYLIAENIPKGAELAVLLHEVGVHMGMNNLLGNKNMSRLSDQIQSFAFANNKSLESKIALAAMSRIPSNTNPAHMDEELIAYFVEEAVLAGVNPMAVEDIKSSRLASWFRSFMAATKASLRKIGLARFDLLKTKDIVNLAYGAADLELAGTYHGTAADFRNFNHDYMSTGEGAQAYGWGTYLAQKRGIGEDYRRQDTARKRKSGAVWINGVDYPANSLTKLMQEIADDFFPTGGYVNYLAVNDVLNGLISGRYNIPKAKAAIAQIANDIKMHLTVSTSLSAKAQADLQSQIDELDRFAIALDTFHFERASNSTDEGSLMHVRPMMHDDELLDLDKKVINQSPLVQKALMRLNAELVKANVLDDILENYNADWEDLTGKEIYEGVLGYAGREALPALPEEYTKAMRNDEFASKYLDSIGIKGSKFLDSTSRDSKYNSVVVRDQGYTQNAPNDPWGAGAWTVTLMEPDGGGKITGWYATEQEANRAANKERANLKLPTRNIIVFNDKNIARTATYRGGQNDTGKNRYSINPQAQAQAQQAIASMSGMYAQSNPQPVQTGAQVAANIGNLVRTNPGGAIEMMERKINAFRNKVVWRGATLADDIQRANDNAFRDAYGNVRADILMSQAENTQNITESVFTFGGVEITPDGSVHAKVADHSIDGVFRNAKTLADRIGADTARELITKTFYAWRAQALLTLPRNEWPINWQQNPSLIPTQAQINAGMAAFNQFPELQAMKTEFIGAKNEAVKFLRQADFLTAEKAAAFLADDSYAPWFRLKEYDDTLPGLGNMGRMVDLKQMQALKGGSEEVNDMLENMAQVVSWFVRSGVSNHTANQALKTMQDMGTATPQRSRPTGTNPDNIVMTYVDGKRMFWTVSDPLQLQAFQSVKAINSPVIKAMSKGLGTLRAGIVLFPAFPIRQVVMDSYRAYAQSGVDHPARMVGKVFKSFLSGEAYKAMSDDILEMKKYGVVGSADFNLSDSTRGRAEAFGLQGPEKGITATWLRSPVYKALHNFAYSADLAVRLGIYRQTMEETGDKELAIARAREIINFQKSGNSELMLTLKQLIPFMGAYAQGTDVNYRSMIGRGNSMKSRKAAAAAFWGNMTTLAALTVAYTMSMSGEDEYEEQKGFITDRNFIIPGIGLLPVPPDIGFLSKVIPERITDYILQEGTDNPESVSRLAEGIRGAAGAAYLPPAAVYGITPAIELGLNRSFFTDIPIVGQYMQGLEPFQQYTSSTSELAKTAGGIANMSPMQIDYLLKALGGTTGGALIQMFDVFASDGKIAREKNIILGTFQKKEVGGRYTEEFYETRALVDKSYQTIKALYESGDEAKLTEYAMRPEVQRRMDIRSSVEQINTTLQDVRAARVAIENDPSLTPDEKRQRVNELQSTVEQFLKEAGIRQLRSESE